MAYARIQRLTPAHHAKFLFLVFAFLVLASRLVAGSFKPSPQNMYTRKLPIIYSPHYNITLFGLQKLHPFDSEKYAKVVRHLTKQCSLHESQFYQPTPLNDCLLLTVHTPEYLSSLHSRHTIANIAEMGLLTLFPAFLLQRKILAPMKLATAGTVQGVELAMEHGWAINLSGGYHHAKAEMGGGFCFFSDIAVAIYQIWKKNASAKVLIIDLDAHQGNGHEAILKQDPRVIITDVYNTHTYPNDIEAKAYIDFDFPIGHGTMDSVYLETVKRALDQSMQQQPDFIVYNAGTDIFELDPLGGLCVSEQGILERDEMVFRCALEVNVPILMVLSGGYTKHSGPIIGRSIENLLRNVVRCL